MKPKPITSPAFLVLALCALLCSCAQTKPQIPSAQESVDTWKDMEKQSQGHSPRGQFQLVEPPAVIDRPVQIDENRRDAQKALPESRLSLRMHNADIVAVLQALSRAVGKSIVVSPGVTGVINVNFVERPWSEVFRAILGSNMLTYSFDGETIRVMAQADLQGNLELATTRRKAQSERRDALADEPQVTSVAKVRFADAKLLQKTVENSLSKTRDGKAIGSVQVDELTNSLIIQGVEQDIGKIGRLLARLDAPRAQIKLKAHIVETTKEVARDLGILWGGGYTGDVRSGNKLGIGGACGNLARHPAVGRIHDVSRRRAMCRIKETRWTHLGDRLTVSASLHAGDGVPPLLEGFSYERDRAGALVLGHQCLGAVIAIKGHIPVLATVSRYILANHFHVEVS